MAGPTPIGMQVDEERVMGGSEPPSVLPVIMAEGRFPLSDRVVGASAQPNGATFSGDGFEELGFQQAVLTSFVHVNGSQPQ